jgi:preprotein translocase subunit SecA
MAQRDPLVEYQREGFALFQSMMGQIREESVGFLFNLEVQVSGGGQATTIDARGLAGSAPTQGLSYSAPSADGDVEVRNQRGQVEAAATARAQRAQAEQEQATVNPAFGGPQQAPPQQPAQPAQRPAAQGGQQPAARGAFGQRTEGNQPAPQNRAQRRAQDKRR